MTEQALVAQDARQAVVLRLLAAVGAGDRDEIAQLLTADYVLVEPASLPWGGEHHGPAGYLEAIGAITDIFSLGFAIRLLATLPAASVSGPLVVLVSDVTFTRRGDAQCSVTVPVTEWFTLTGERLSRSDVHISDTAALLNLLADGR